MSQTVLPGTLELLALKTISLGAEHGFGVLQRIQMRSGGVLQIEQGALYPALHRLEARGLVSTRWGVSENRRKAKYYELTENGRERLAKDQDQWRSLVSAMESLLNASAEPQT